MSNLNFIKFFIRFILILILFYCPKNNFAIWSINSDENPIIYLENQKVERFEVSINTINPNIDKNNEFIEKVKGLIILPIGYSTNGRPTKLMIYCHSGGGNVTDETSEAENENYCRYFVSLGYAVMDMAALPESFSARLKIDRGRTVGSFVAVRSYLQGYDYVMKNYNIDKKGCYTFSNSNGGAVSLNLGNLTEIPIIAQAGICPLLSIEQNGWFIDSGATNGGEFALFQNRANIIRIYGMKNITSQEDLNNSTYEKEKVGIFDPYEYIINLSNTPYPIPFKIFQTKDDPKVYFKIAKNLVEVDNLRGGQMVLHAFDKGGHTSEPINENIGLFTYMKRNYPITPTILETAIWFEKYGGNKHLYTAIDQFHDNLILYPNPTNSGTFYIIGIEGIAKLKIFDINGKLLLSKEVKNKEQISINSFKQGLYIVKISTNRGNSDQLIEKI